MNEDILNRIRDEIDGDKREYLLNCKNNYLQYADAAIIIFPEYYSNIDNQLEIEKEFNKAIKFKEAGDFDSELSILISLIERKASTPAIYKRAASLYYKQKEFEKSKEVFIKWFDYGYWKIPNMATSSLLFLDKLESHMKSKKS